MGADAHRWFAFCFRPVSDALIDGKPKDEILRIWRMTEKKYEKDGIGGGYTATGGHREHRIMSKTIYFVKARELDKRHDWNTVK